MFDKMKGLFSDFLNRDEEYNEEEDFIEDSDFEEEEDDKVDYTMQSRKNLLKSRNSKLMSMPDRKSTRLNSSH